MSTPQKKITPNLWFDDQAEEAATFYTSLFPNSEVGRIARYDEAATEQSGKSVGDVLTVDFQIAGQPFVGLNGGPQFKINPSISFFVNFDPSRDSNARENLDDLWEKLSDGGTALMPLDTYPFSERYGWIEDRYGVSWQLILSDPDGEERPVIVPSLMFVGDVCGRAEEAINFYTSIFENSSTGLVARYPAGSEPDREGTLMFADFMLENQWFAAMDSAHDHAFTFNEAVSLIVDCETQDEVDYFWDKLIADGGEESMCGWLKDPFGVSWQVVPTGLTDLLFGPDPEGAGRAMQAMLQMRKLDIATLREAYEQD